VRISTREIPVSYEDVLEIVPTLHVEFDIIIHVGVGRNGFITLEKQADSGGYYGSDIHGRHGPLESQGVYVTRWDVQKLVHQMSLFGYNVCSLRLPRVIGRRRRLLCQMTRGIICVSTFTFGV
jgi:hypothetical protein